MRADLPGLLGEIADVAGVDAAIAIAQAKGGMRASIPTPARLGDTHWLVIAVGIDKAVAIARHLQVGNTGQEYVIPIGPAGRYMSEQRARSRAIDAALSEASLSGLTIDEAAARAGVDRSTVIRWRQRQRRRPDTRQGSLF